MRLDALRTWNHAAFGANEKRRFVGARNVVLNALAARDKVRPIVNRADRSAEELRQNDPYNYQGMFEAAQRAVVRNLALASRQQILIGALTYFMNAVFNQNLHLRVRLLARNELVTANTELARVQTVIAQRQAEAIQPPPVPQMADGRYKVFEYLVPKWKKGLQQSTRRTVFATGGGIGGQPLVQDTDLRRPGETWEGGWMLGGGMSMNGIFVRLDLNNIVQARTVRKDTEFSRWQWLDAGSWDMDDVEDRDENRVPMEAGCQYEISNVAGRSTEEPMAPQVMGCSLDREKRIYTIYSTYCPHGDLHTLIWNYRQNNQCVPPPIYLRPSAQRMPAIKAATPSAGIKLPIFERRSDGMNCQLESIC